MPAYLIFIRDRVKDADVLEEYRRKALAAVGNHPMNILSRGPVETWEGEPADGLVLMEFPNLDAARAWYESPAYQEAKHDRIRGADYRLVVSETADNIKS